MVQIVENWTCVTGIVLSISQPPAHGGQRSDNLPPAALEIEIEDSVAVEGSRSLITEKAGERIKILLPQPLAGAGDLRGRRMRIPVRMVRPGRYFAAADWTPQGGSRRCGPNPGTALRK